MVAISRTALFGKLSDLSYKSIEGATVFCKIQSNPSVELVHWFHQLLQHPNSDVSSIVRHFSLDAGRLAADFTSALQGLPEGVATGMDLSPQLEEATERAWVLATLKFADTAIRSGYLVLASLTIPSTSRQLHTISSEFRKIDPEQLAASFNEIVGGSVENGMGAKDGWPLNLRRAGQKSQIFLSYRRTDSRHFAGRVSDCLIKEFGEDKVFRDVTSVLAGVRDFGNEILSQLKLAKVVIALIGPQWLTQPDETGRRRLDDKSDFVRLELKTALESNVPLVPLLFDGAVMPAPGSLPSVLKKLSRVQGHVIRDDPHFHSDMVELLKICRIHIDGVARSSQIGT